MIRIAVVGAAGRMGQTLLRLAAEADDLRVTGAIVRPGSAADGEAVPGHDGLAYTGDPAAGLASAEVVLDFAAPPAGEPLVKHCAENGAALLVGTTGLTTETRAALEAAARRTAVLVAPNTSLGVNVLLDLVRRTAAALGDEYDIEIVEAHHARKADAPSGTALRLGEEAASARGRELDAVAVHDREGQMGPRGSGDIGFSVIRGGDIAGEHTVYFAGPGERIELTHRASSRDTFARGALNSARWLAGRGPGLYDMNDVLSSAAGRG